MTSLRRAAGLSALLLVAPLRGPGAPTDGVPVLEAMKIELARSLAALRAQPTPPYFLGYGITEVHTVALSAAFGAISERREDRRRALAVDVRVGDYAFDNTHDAGGRFPGFPDFADLVGSMDVPIDDDPMAIRAVLWSQTDRKFRGAVARLGRVRAGAEVRVAPEDSSPDFSREPPERYTEPPARLAVDRSAWEAKIRRYTLPFARHADVYGATATFTAAVQTRWYVNSEGTEIQTSQPIYRLHIAAFTKAEDGMELPRYESFFAFDSEGLPDDSVVLGAVDRMIGDLRDLRRAPTIEPYTGPAILSGRASAVFFHEILGHRLEGHRQKREEEGQTFTRRVNDAILPPAFSVSFDPTLPRLAGTDLAGFYRFDDEGVRARRVAAIEGGVLKTFLMSRAPIEGFASSNGHGRRQIGFAPVARQSNLIVEVARPRTRAQLKQLLLDQVRRERKPFGLFFDDIEGGFTITTRGFPNAFEVLPVMVYRIYPDGREELVRGVDLIGTPLTVFSRVTAADDRVEVFNGLCGAESGFVPVSAASPAVFIAQIEVQKKPKSVDLAPLLPPPPDRADTGDVIMRAMRDELARSMTDLRLDTLPRPYFVAYRMDEFTNVRAAGTRGSLVSSDEDRSRRVSVELRVGDYAFDNTNFFGAPSGGFGLARRMRGMEDAPLDDDYAVLRRQLWLATDGLYKDAVENLGRKRAALAQRMRREQVPDFSREEVVTVRDTGALPRLDRAAAEAFVRDVSAALREPPEIHESGASWSGEVARTWYANSEGTWFVRTSPAVTVQAHAATRATDGMPLGDVLEAYARTPADLPGRATFVAAARARAQRLALLRGVSAPAIYRGPVLFEGEAAAQLVGRLLAPGLVAVRMPMSDEPMFEQFVARRGSSLLDQIGARVLPRFLGVIDDPTVRTHDGRSLGGYLVDDDGVRARRTTVVERGILKTLLTTRTPVRGILRSTGNRWGEGAAVSNLFVTSDSGLTAPELRRRLLALAAARSTPYAIVVRRLGEPFGGDGDAMAFLADMAEPGDDDAMVGVADGVKLFPDGREEPLRGANLTGLGIASFKSIVAASRARSVTTISSDHLGRFGGLGMAGLMRGWFRMPPASAASVIAPSLLFEEAFLRPPTGDGSIEPAIPPPWAPER